jgi:hypothetical protein
VDILYFFCIKIGAWRFSLSISDQAGGMALVTTRFLPFFDQVDADGNRGRSRTAPKL